MRWREKVHGAAVTAKADVGAPPEGLDA